MSSPPRTTLPLSGATVPAMMLNRVDFPAPFAPIIVTNSPLATFSERESKTFWLSAVPGWKVLEMPSSLSIAASFPVVAAAGGFIPSVC